jgi:hypothetical protein
LNVAAANRARVAFDRAIPSTRGGNGYNGKTKDPSELGSCGGKRLLGSSGSIGRVGITYGRRIG